LPINQSYENEQHVSLSSNKTSASGTNYYQQGTPTSNTASQQSRFLKFPDSAYETSSLRNLRDISSLSSTSLNHKDSGVRNSITNDSICTSTLSDSQSKVMENYLILDRLNQKQQRKQQIKLKQQQQLDDLKQKQQSLETKHLEKMPEQIQNSVEQQSNFINSKLAAHYNETTTNSAVNNNSSFDQTKFKLKVHHPSQLQQFQLNQKLTSQNQFIQNSHDLNVKNVNESNKTVILDKNNNFLSPNKLPKSKNVSKEFFKIVFVM